MQGFVEVKIGVSPDQAQFLANNIQYKRGKYGTKNHFTSTIHAAMGGTIQSIVTKISRINGN